MEIFRPTKVLSLLLLAGVLAACDGVISSAGDTIVDADALDVVAVDPEAPPLVETEVSFWAVRGQSRAVEIRYADSLGYNGTCMRFVVPAEAPLRHADGSVIAPGDSVRITIRVLDAAKFLFEFDPAGVRFDPSKPARLEVRYRWAEADINGDGLVDERDASLASRFSIWRQETPGAHWMKIPSSNLREIQEVHAEITGFTRYALATDRHRG